MTSWSNVFAAAGRNQRLSIAYHDKEWGVPVHDDRVLFEFITLEGAQAGLSWETILKKRDAYRKAFADFDPVKVARFTPARVERLMEDAGIVRNRLKIESTVSNAKAFLAVQREFGSFDAYLWKFVGGKPIVSRHRSMRDYPVRTAESDALSRDLKKRGFRFVGTTICYAFMQAVGMVDDHMATCFRARSGGHRAHFHHRGQQRKQSVPRITELSALSACSAVKKTSPTPQRPLARAWESTRCRTRRPSAVRGRACRARRTTASGR